MKALSGSEEPAVHKQSPQQLLSSRQLAGPLNLSSQVLVERLPLHCRIVRLNDPAKTAAKRVGVGMAADLRIEDSLQKIHYH